MHVSGTHVYVSGTHIYVSRTHIYVSGTHICVYGTHIFLSEAHIHVSGTHVYVSATHICFRDTRKHLGHAITRDPEVRRRAFSSRVDWVWSQGHYPSEQARFRAKNKTETEPEGRGGPEAAAPRKKQGGLVGGTPRNVSTTRKILRLIKNRK